VDDRDSNDPWSESPPRKRWGLVIAVLLLAAVAGCGITLFLFHNNQQAEADAVRATEGRLTLAEDDGKSLELVDRQQRPEIWYRVMLADAPVGGTLSLTCEWVGPDGKVVRRNHYTTQPIDRPNWPTHARHRFDPSAPVGAWTVRLKLGDRVLQSIAFEVQDGGKPGKGAP
jgi:hypothetical protein